MGTYAVLRISAWRLYSLANTKGTIPWGRAACELWNIKLYMFHRKKKTSNPWIELVDWLVTWTIATCRRTPRRPMAMEVAAMTAGPVKNLTTIENAATDFPQAMILGCNAMKRPVQFKPTHVYIFKVILYINLLCCWALYMSG